MFEPVVGEGGHIVDRGRLAALRIDRQTEFGDPVERLGVGGEAGAALNRTELVGPEGQTSGRGDRRILLPQTSGRGVAGVGVAGQAGFGLGLVERLERGDWHVDLASDLDHCGRLARPRVCKGVGDHGDPGDVGRDVLTDPAVTPGGGLDEATVLVAQRAGHAVDLQLTGVADGRGG